MKEIDKEITDALELIEKNVHKLENGGGIDVSVKDTQEKIDWAFSRIKALGIELGQLDDQDVSRKYRKKTREYEKTLKDSQNQLKWATAGKNTEEDTKEQYGMYKKK